MPTHLSETKGGISLITLYRQLIFIWTLLPCPVFSFPFGIFGNISGQSLSSGVTLHIGIVVPKVQRSL